MIWYEGSSFRLHTNSKYGPKLIEHDKICMQNNQLLNNIGVFDDIIIFGTIQV